MTEAPNLFTDGKAYEQLMGRWSRVAGETEHFTASVPAR